MLRSGEALDAGIAAVMVGDQQAFVGDNLPGASASELHYRVLEGSFVDGIDVLGGKAAAYVAHRFGIEFLEEGQKPHPLVGTRHHANGECESGKDSLHNSQIYELFLQGFDEAVQICDGRVALGQLLFVVFALAVKLLAHIGGFFQDTL